MKYNLIVVGSGPGGYVAAIRASQLGLKTAVIEKESLGGICLNWGCIPTKALLKSAEVLQYLGHANDYGVNVKDSSADLAEIIKRSRGVADGMSKGVQFLMKKNKIDVIMGTGKLARGKKVEVTDDKGAVTTYEAEHIIIATGARAKALPNIPIDGVKVIEYRKAMVPEKQPKALVVIGAGAIGVEFAYFYHALGTKVTVIEFLEQGLVPREDPEVSKELKKHFTRSGIDVLANTAVEKVDISGKTIKVTAKDQ
jgi:dihydrolipoamide dehydrogenase